MKHMKAISKRPAYAQTYDEGTPLQQLLVVLTKGKVRPD